MRIMFVVIIWAFWEERKKIEKRRGRGKYVVPTPHEVGEDDDGLAISRASKPN